MPFIPAIVAGVVEAATAASAAVADAAATAAASVGLTGAADAAATGAEVGGAAASSAEVGGGVAATSTEVGASSEIGSAGGDAAEVGGEETSTARTVGNVGKQVYKGAKRADDINNSLNGNSNSNNQKNSGIVGADPLSNVIEKMRGISSNRFLESPVHAQESEGPQKPVTESGHRRVAVLHNPQNGVYESSSEPTTIDVPRNSGRMKV